MDDTDFRSVSIEVEREHAAANDILTPKHEMPCQCCGYLPCYWRRADADLPMGFPRPVVRAAMDRGEPLSATAAALEVADADA